MPGQAELTVEQVALLAAEWKAAVTDAGLPAARCLVYPFPAPRPPGATGAFLLDPGTKAIHDENFPGDPGQLAHANRHRNFHRIGVYVEGSALLVGARLRHELEHARQVEQLGIGVLTLSRFVLGLLAPYVERRGGGLFYNMLPIERDANAAAAMFTRARHPMEVQRAIEAGDEELGLVRWRVGPEPIESLPSRTVCFAHQFRTLAERHAEENGAEFADLLETHCSGAGALWVTLAGS